MANDVIMTVVVIGTTYLMVLPFASYCIFIFIKHSKEVYIQIRFPKLVLSLLIWFTFGMLIYNPIDLIDQTFDLNWTKNIFVIIIIYPALLFGTLSILCLKYWLVIFKFKHQNAITKQEWQSIINPKLTTSFWIKHKKTLGMSHPTPPFAFVNCSGCVTDTITTFNLHICGQLFCFNFDIVCKQHRLIN